MLRKGSFQGTLNDYNTQLPPLADLHFSLPETMTPDQLVAFVADGIARLLSSQTAASSLSVASIALQGVRSSISPELCAIVRYFRNIMSISPPCLSRS